ncbi:hypothetical protein [Microlunatus sagamiharensis]|uniref:hypothetical protein n=1 Tax=Microlunatus sagamiharensis TaxID=546874 RepID=UPI0012FD8B60|nr:hypothetical protein [Microlunatus sagamiharensis]
MLTKGTTNKGTDRGRFRQLRASATTVAEKQFWESMWDTTATTAQVTNYDNPVRRVSIRPGKARPLDAADLAWIQRLPADPAKISPEDVQALKGMASQAAMGTSDHRLIRAVLGPVETYHAKREAEANLANLSRPLTQIPANAADALSAILAREVPDLRDDERYSRASAMVRDAVNHRRDLHLDQVAEARAAAA